MYTVASPDPNPRGRGQLPNPNECNSTLTSGTNNIYPYHYIDINDRGHRLRITHTERRLSFMPASQVSREFGSFSAAESTEHSENKLITQSGLFENEIGPGVL